jgi:transposase
VIYKFNSYTYRIFRDREENLVHLVSKVRKAIAEKRDRRESRDIEVSTVCKDYPGHPAYPGKKVRLVCQDLLVKTESLVLEVILEEKVVQDLLDLRETLDQEVHLERKVVAEHQVFQGLLDHPVLLETSVSLTMPHLWRHSWVINCKL